MLVLDVLNTNSVQTLSALGALVSRVESQLLPAALALVAGNGCMFTESCKSELTETPSPSRNSSVSDIVNRVPENVNE